VEWHPSELRLFVSFTVPAAPLLATRNCATASKLHRGVSPLHGAVLDQAVSPNWLGQAVQGQRAHQPHRDSGLWRRLRTQTATSSAPARNTYGFTLM
jgi:hypothetical protein